ncbi:MAG: hypothetical protein ACE366_12780 [Bradymonadia bacterium]
MGQHTLETPALLVSRHERGAEEIFEAVLTALRRWPRRRQRLQVIEQKAPTIITAVLEGEESHLTFEVGIAPEGHSCQLGVRISGTARVPGIPGHFVHEPQLKRQLTDKLGRLIDEALSGETSASSAPSASASQAPRASGTIERSRTQRLSLLDHLLDEGLINRREHAEKRASILWGRQ